MTYPFWMMKNEAADYFPGPSLHKNPDNSIISAQKSKNYMRYGNYTKRSFNWDQPEICTFSRLEMRADDNYTYDDELLSFIHHFQKGHVIFELMSLLNGWSYKNEIGRKWKLFQRGFISYHNYPSYLTILVNKLTFTYLATLIMIKIVLGPWPKKFARSDTIALNVFPRRWLSTPYKNIYV